METKARKIILVKAKERREKGGRRKETRRKRIEKKRKKKEKTKERENDRSKEAGWEIENIRQGRRSSKIGNRSKKVGTKMFLQVNPCLWQES